MGIALTRYRGPMSSPRVPGGVVHKLPRDLRKALIANPTHSMPGRTSRLWPATSSSAGSKMPSRRRPEHAAFAGPRRSWKMASVGPAAGQGASTASAPQLAVGWMPLHANYASQNLGLKLRLADDRSHLGRPLCASG